MFSQEFCHKTRSQHNHGMRKITKAFHTGNTRGTRDVENKYILPPNSFNIMQVANIPEKASIVIYMTHCQPFILRTKTPNQIYLHFAIIKNHSRHACLSCDEAQPTPPTFLPQIILTTWLHLTHADSSQTVCLRDLSTFNQTSRRHTQEPQNYKKIVDRSVSYNTERIFHLRRLVQTIGFTKCRIGNGYQKVSLEDKEEVAAAFEVMWYTTVPEQTWPKVLSWTVWLVVLLSRKVGDCCHFHKQLTRTRSSRQIENLHLGSPDMWSCRMAKASKQCYAEVDKIISRLHWAVHYQMNLLNGLQVQNTWKCGLLSIY